MKNNLWNPQPIQPTDKEKGQSLMEMAFAVVILLLLLAGIVDVGRLLFTYVAIRDAAQEGAAFASICTDSARISQHVKTSSYYPVNLSAGNIQVISNIAPNIAPGDQVEVTVIYQNFVFIMPILNLVDGDFQATAKDVLLQYDCPPLASAP